MNDLAASIDQATAFSLLDWDLGPLSVSFEFFPPSSEKMEETLWQAITRLEPLAPDFVSVTYGAGGTTRERTHNTVIRILRETSLTPAAHLTCVGASRGEIDDIARRYWDEGVRHLVALRGDPPDGAAGYQPFPGGYAYAADLVAGLKRIADFDISVAGYPDVHPAAPSPQFDLDYLKRKVDAGASRVITQYFFDPAAFLRFRDKARAAGVAVPIVPGIMPVTNFAQIARFSAGCGAVVPDWLGRHFHGLDEDPATRRLVASAIVAEQCRQLIAAGVHEFHFYTLNRAELTAGICHLLGMRPKETGQ
ncbi:MAG: methylenetetrahydrofolate reductase [NAD(P)H] [Alphaproteobacteria bacterium]|nr:methylenetetrahydrofolate reductase [NAD(P)H] [Alphaproteobacteria bacterium]